MRSIKFLLTTLTLAAHAAAIAAPTAVTLYKNPSCYCCDLYAKHLEEHGFKVALVDTVDMAAVKQKYRVPEALEGCHTAIVDGRVVEGLVPAQLVRRMLGDRGVRGLALPGMPVGAPGMPGAKSQPLAVYAIEPGRPAAVYATF